VIGISHLLAGVDVDKDCHPIPSYSFEGEDRGITLASLSQCLAGSTPASRDASFMLDCQRVLFCSSA